MSASVDDEVRAALAKGDVSGATSIAIRSYGPEVFGFVCVMLEDYDEASEVFSSVSERLWTTLPTFEWRCSLRTWCYRIARSAAIDHLRQRQRAQKRRVALSDAPEVMELAERVRTQTLTFLRTEKRTEIERLRDELSEHDRLLLVLRVDRNLEWHEVAVVLGEESIDPNDPEAVKREAARLRKQFQLLKERVREMAKARGIVE
jgi:RNA polymerase sigma-70 factor (ECF subfamily)